VVDLSYDEWRNRLFDLLVGTGEAGRPLYLFVDRDDLAEAGGYDDPAEALVGFTTAYRQQAPRVEPFRYEYLLSLSFDPASADQLSSAERLAWKGTCPTAAAEVHQPRPGDVAGLEPVVGCWWKQVRQANRAQPPALDPPRVGA
jgi:hypothetical protein